MKQADHSYINYRNTWVQLLSGAAEVFGSEIGIGQELSLSAGSKIAIFSWYGAQIKLTGEVESSYVAEDTPMRFHLNIHANLEERRRRAKEGSTEGPRTMIVGPTDSGKSSLCKLLLNYAVRMDWEPLFVDLDVGQTMITIPGTVGATCVKEPINVEKGLPLEVMVLE